MLGRQRLDLVIIDEPGFGIEAVLHGIEHLAREIDLGTVRQVPAFGEAHAEHGVAGIEQRQVDSRVGL